MKYYFLSNIFEKLIINRIIFESLGMFDEKSKNCSSSNIMAPKLVDYTNDDLQKSFFFSEYSINLAMFEVQDLDK